MKSTNWKIEPPGWCERILTLIMGHHDANGEPMNTVKEVGTKNRFCSEHVGVVRIP